MKRLTLLSVGLLPLMPGSAIAHEAFGDLGPFYTNMLHPVVDPLQGLLIVGAGALLARQPIETVRLAYAVFALCAALAVSVLGLHPIAAPNVKTTAAAAAFLGVLTVIGLHLPRRAAAGLCAAVAVIAASAFDMSGAGMAGVQKAIGGALGLAVALLFVWGTMNWTLQRLHPAAGAVAGSWVAAVGLLVLALPN